MSSGGSDSTSSSTTTGIPEWVTPYAQNYMGRSQQVADMPYQGYGGQTVAQLNPYQTGAYNAIAGRASAGSPVTDAASGELQRTLSGAYLGNNPYLNQMVDASSQDVLRNYNSVIRPQQDAMSARSGSYGNTGVGEYVAGQQYDLGRTLSGISTGIRSQDYAAERNRMQGAVGMAPTIANQDYVDAQQLLQAGQGLQGQEQANLTDQYNRFNEARNYPQQQLATLGRGLGLNFGSTTNTVATGPGSNSTAQGLGSALALYSAYRGAMGSSSGGGAK